MLHALQPKITKLILGIIFLSINIAFAQNLIVYNWPEYIDPQVITDFEQSTGIKVEYHTYKTTMEASNLFDNNTIADVIIPSHFMLPKLINEGKIQPLNNERLPNRKNLNADFMLKLQSFDPKSNYAIPYLMTITAIATNRELVSAKPDWNLIFDDNLRSKVAKCGVSVLNSPMDMLSIWLHHTGQTINNVPENKIKKFLGEITKIKNDAKYLDSGIFYPNDLANNEICAAVVYSGSAIKATFLNNKIDLIIPDNYAILTIDTMVIPKTAKNIDNAYTFINYMLRPAVAAKIVNVTNYTSAVNGVQQLVRAELQNNQLLFPNRQEIRNFNLLNNISPDKAQLLNASWVSYYQSNR